MASKNYNFVMICCLPVSGEIVPFDYCRMRLEETLDSWRKYVHL